MQLWVGLGNPGGKYAGNRHNIGYMALDRIAEEHGFSLDEILGKKTSGKTAVPKYRNPENPSQTWTGRGRQPAWYKSAIAAGKDASEMEI